MAKAIQGFTGQIERGWDALVSVVGNLVLLFGLLLPWLGALAVAAGIVYGIVRLAGTRRSHQGPPAPRRPHSARDGVRPSRVASYEARRMPRFSKSSRSDSDRPPQMP